MHSLPIVGGLNTSQRLNTNKGVKSQTPRADTQTKKSLSE
jgi:hypothetical protein